MNSIDLVNNYCCPKCYSTKFKSFSNKYVCNSCKYVFEKTLFDEKITLDETITNEKIKVLRIARKYEKAYLLLRERQKKMIGERRQEKKEQSIQRVRQQKQLRINNGLCTWCSEKNDNDTSVYLCKKCTKKKNEHAKKKYLEDKKKMEQHKYSHLEVGFEKVSKEQIPEMRRTQPNLLVKQAEEQMKTLGVGEALLIPISRELPQELREVATKKYVYACCEARKKVAGTFSVMQRGEQVYILRKE